MADTGEVGDGNSARNPDNPVRQPILRPVADAARQGEPDRYIGALLAPRGVARDLLALAAFAAEVARIPAQVSDPLLGEIRLQWWRDAIQGMAEPGRRTGHPVADALGQMIDDRRMLHGPDAAAENAVRQALIERIDATSFDLQGSLHADDAALARHLWGREGVLFALALTLTPRQHPEAAFEEPACRLAGTAYGIARLLGRLPALMHNGGFPIPQALLTAAGLPSEELTAVPRSPATATAVAKAADRLQVQGREALTQARQHIARLRPAARTAFSPLVMVEPYFRLQTARRLELLDGMAEIPQLERMWRMALARLTGRY